MKRDFVAALLIIVVIAIFMALFTVTGKFSQSSSSVSANNTQLQAGQLSQCEKLYMDNYDTAIIGMSNPFNAKNYTQLLLDATAGRQSCQKQYGGSNECVAMYQKNYDLAKIGVSNPNDAAAYTPILSNATTGLQSC